jgi:hypothetical protein
MPSNVQEQALAPVVAAVLFLMQVRERTVIRILRVSLSSDG